MVPGGGVFDDLKLVRAGLTHSARLSAKPTPPHPWQQSLLRRQCDPFSLAVMNV